MKENKSSRPELFDSYKASIDNKDCKKALEQVEELYQSEVLNKVHDKYTVLNYALDSNDEGVFNEVITHILSYDPEIDALIDDTTPLMIATDQNDIQSIKSLFDNDVKLETQCSYGETALLRACSNSCVKIATIELIISLGANVNAQDCKGETPLMRALYLRDQGKRSTMIQLLLEHGADTLIQDNKGCTVIMKACSHRTMGLQDLELLLNEKNVKVKDKKGKNALMYLLRSPLKSKDKKFEDMNLLISALIDINDADAEGNTSLIYAARHNNHVGLLDKLIQMGAHEGIKNEKGQMYTHFMFKPEPRRLSYIRECLEDEGLNKKIDGYGKK